MKKPERTMKLKYEEGKRREKYWKISENWIENIW